MKKRKGFTLIELLVVIAIIALLLAIVVPSLKKAKEYAQFLICKTNLKQYGVAGFLYLDENDNKFIEAHVWLYEGGGDPYGDYVDLNKEPDGPMWPYLNSKKINMCPVFDILASRLYKPDYVPDDHDALYSYGQNGFLGEHPDSYDWEAAVSRADITTSTASVFFYSEENPFPIPGLSSVALNDNCLLAGRRGDMIADCFATYHRANGTDVTTGVANAVMLDGHVETVEAVDTEEWAWPFNTDYPYGRRN